MKKTLLLLITVCLLTACNTGRQFTARKYTKGRYVSHAARVHKPESKPGTVEAQEAVVKAEQETVGAVALTEHKTVVAQEHKTVENMPVQRSAKATNRKIPVLKENKFIQAFNTIAKKEQAQKAGDFDSEKKGLKSVIFSGLGFVLDIVGLIVAIATLEYFFFAFVIAGFILGTIGMIMGIGAIKGYKREKQAGNKNKTTLILGIIGTAVGGAAMFAALYCAILGTLIVFF